LNIPGLGVGLVYIPGLEPLFEARDGAVQVLELEPQALWRQYPHRPQPYGNQAELLNRIKAWPQRKIVHGVGFPVGGSRVPDPRHLPPLCEAIETIGADWASEHLVFNEAQDSDGSVYQTGFFLPPLLTPLGVEAAVSTIRAVASGVETFLSEIPLDRVWEIHLAGGLKYGDFWLDAHSGDIPQPVLE